MKKVDCYNFLFYIKMSDRNTYYQRDRKNIKQSKRIK